MTRRQSRFAFAGLAGLLGAAVACTPVAAADLCKSRVDGVGTGSGPFGQGSKKARARAIDNWETAAAVHFGARYAKFNNAVAAKWDCRSGALQAKCVVTAVACK